MERKIAMTVTEKYKLWLEQTRQDPELAAELAAIAGDDAQIEDRFYRELEFGTGGLRGVLGAGTNRMNIYTVAKATQGFAQFLKEQNPNPKVAISYDSRINSDLFARRAAEVLAGNGVQAYLYPELMPTPALSFAVRRLGCDGGIMITASHNPSEYNGYKAYGPDGCQLGLEESKRVLEHINKVDPFSGVCRLPYDRAVEKGLISIIGADVPEAYYTAVLKQQINPGLCGDSDLNIIYTPLHGSGNKPVREILRRIGISHVTVVPEQELPDGKFPTAPYPNPEVRQAFDCALKLARELSPDLLLATDPDCDRVGIAVRDGEDYTLMSGNEVGALLLHYVITQRLAHGTMPARPLAVKTIVTSEICTAICKKYGVELVNVLTGFKFIGELIGKLEAAGEENRYIFGFEESYGYLAGTYVRDKDAVVASMLICEMAAYYKSLGKSLLDAMADLYQEFGMYLAAQKSFTCKGAVGMQQMKSIMDSLRKNPPRTIAGFEVLAVDDYENSVSTRLATGETSPILLPKSDVVAFQMAGEQSVIVRPSGTEPKIKIYMGAHAGTREKAAAIAAKMERDMTAAMGFSE